MKKDVGLEEAFCGRGGTVVGDFDEDSSCKSDFLTGLSDELWLLNEFHVLPPRVARDSFEQPLTCDFRAVRVTSRHERKFEERCRSSVKHLNIHSVDLLELLRQGGVVFGFQHLREGEDKITAQSVGDISRLESGEHPP